MKLFLSNSRLTVVSWKNSEYSLFRLDIYSNPLNGNDSSPSFNRVIETDYDCISECIFTKFDSEFVVFGWRKDYYRHSLMEVWKVSSPLSGGYLVDKMKVFDIYFESCESPIKLYYIEKYQVCLFEKKFNLGWSGSSRIFRGVDLKTFKVFDPRMDVGESGNVWTRILLSPTKIICLNYHIRSNRGRRETIWTMAMI
jgi:hypothetical protein